MKSRNFFAALLLTLIHLSGAYAQVFNQKFDSRGHPKAKGAWVTVRYPAGWESTAGDRPNVVQKFTGEFKGYFTVLMLHVQRVDSGLENECRGLSASEATREFSEPGAGVAVSNLRKIRHEQKPGFIFDLQTSVERAGIAVEQYQRNMLVCHKDWMIAAVCQPMKIDRVNRRVFGSTAMLTEVEPLCFQFFNSLVLMDQY